MNFDPVFLSRIQFAFTISFHIIFPSFTIGLASWLALLEWKWLRTRDNIYKEIYKFWVKIFAVAFGMGVVSGVVLSYQFGTNWSGFSDKVGNIIGPLMGMEVLTAFFLESSFLGIMLFGFGRVSNKMHFTSTLIVAIGTVISAFWIISANSWMQTPVGFEVRENNVFHPTSWMEIIFNPSFPYRFMHMILGAYITTAFVTAGVGAFYLLKNRFIEHAKIMFKMSMLMIAITTPLQIIVGDLHGLNTVEHQPAKVAAIEGIWDTEKGAALTLFGWPDEKKGETRYAVKLPKMASLILTHDRNGELKGWKSFKEDERPPVKPVFFAFRIMVGIGILMLFTGLMSVYLNFKGRLYNTMWFKRWAVAMIPSGFIAVLSGWYVAEIGRQPFVVYGIIKTKDSASPILGEHVAFSLAAFVVVYTIIFGFAIYYINNLIQKGIISIKDEEIYGTHGLGSIPIPESLTDEHLTGKAQQKKV